MARQAGIVKFNGTLGDITFFYRNGEYIAKLKSEVPSQRILQDPAYQLTRENMAEFSGAAKAGKSFRLAFAGFSKSMGGPNFHPRVLKLIRQVLGKGSGNRGQRNLFILPNASTLEGFEFSLK